MTWFDISSQVKSTSDVFHQKIILYIAKLILEKFYSIQGHEKGEEFFPVTDMLLGHRHTEEWGHGGPWHGNLLQKAHKLSTLIGQFATVHTCDRLTKLKINL